MEKSFPFNAVVTGGVADRVYTAEDFAAERAAFVSNGVAADGALAVSPSAAGGLCIDVATGVAVIDGHTYFNTATLALQVEAAHATLPRVDLCVLRLDLDAREMRCHLKSGTPSLTPAAPALLSTDTVHEIALARVFVAAGATVLTAADITDQRVQADYILNRVEVDALLAQYEAALADYFDEEDAAALVTASKTVRTNAGANTVLCGDGVYRTAALDGGIRVELVRFTQDGTFYPSQYPTEDGRYDIVLQGGGGSGSYGSSISYGGEAGGFLSLCGVPLAKGVGYPVTVGAGGAGAQGVNGYTNLSGRAGGKTSMLGYTVPGGQAGALLQNPTVTPTPTTANGHTQDIGTPGFSGRGGNSLLAAGGRSNDSGSGGDGSLGSGGGVGSGGSSYKSGDGGDGVVIIYGVPLS